MYSNNQTAALPPQGQHGQQSSLLSVVSRLSTFIEQETEQINVNSDFDYKASSERKSRLLFELNRASRGSDPASFDAPVTTELKRLKDLLRRNEMRIRAHLSAVREVSTIMVDILKNEETDGTYSEFF